MKRTYIQPQSIEVSLHTEGMIAASVNIGTGNGDAGDAWTNKKGSTIWGSEEEETQGGIW